MRAVPITVAVGLALLAGTIAAVASRSPPTVAWSDSVPIKVELGAAYRDRGTCQGGERLPAHTSTIRLLIHSPMLGPRVTVEVIRGGRVLTAGERGSGWTAGALTVPVKPLRRTVAGVTTCFAFGPSAWPVELTGRLTPPSTAARNAHQVLPGRVGIEYLRAGSRSWWSRALSMARALGLGHAGGGPLIPLLVLTLMVSIASLSSWLAVRELR
jgi:hypothetical protein